LLEGVIPQLNDTSNASSGPSIVPESPLRHLADVYVPEYAGMNTPFRLTSAEIVQKGDSGDSKKVHLNRLCWLLAFCSSSACVPCFSSSSDAANGQTSPSPSHH
jgi:hypothetical protein